MLKWLNPVNWFKGAVKSAAESVIDEYVTLDKAKNLVVELLNKAVTYSERKWTDEQCASFVRGCRMAVAALNEISDAIDPEGENGRSISVDEFDAILANARCALIELFNEENAEKVREQLKAFVGKKLD